MKFTHTQIYIYIYIEREREKTCFFIAILKNASTGILCAIVKSLQLDTHTHTYIYK